YGLRDLTADEHAPPIEAVDDDTNDRREHRWQHRDEQEQADRGAGSFGGLQVDDQRDVRDSVTDPRQHARDEQGAKRARRLQAASLAAPITTWAYRNDPDEYPSAPASSQCTPSKLRTRMVPSMQPMLFVSPCRHGSRNVQPFGESVVPMLTKLTPTVSAAIFW